MQVNTERFQVGVRLNLQIAKTKIKATPLPRSPFGAGASRRPSSFWRDYSPSLDSLKSLSSGPQLGSPPGSIQRNFVSRYLHHMRQPVVHRSVPRSTTSSRYQYLGVRILSHDNSIHWVADWFNIMGSGLRGEDIGVSAHWYDNGK